MMGKTAWRPAEVALAAQVACLLEVCAPKPGNVNRLHDFADTTFEDFLLSAVAIGPAMARAREWTVGQVILRAVEDTRRLVPVNTNLGIILLLAPLARAAGSESLREGLRAVLAGLTEEDARLAYRAIRLASPGGLGKVPRGDVGEGTAGTLREMMALARERDAIAREYVTDYAVVFELGYPALKEYYRREGTLKVAIMRAFLQILAQVPDTLVERKRGKDAAEEISRQAGLVLEGKQDLAVFDRMLRQPDNSLNPGTTADLTTACIFVALLNGDIPLGEMRRDLMR